MCFERKVNMLRGRGVGKPQAKQVEMGFCGADQADFGARLRRRATALPTKPKPATIIAQLAGSGTFDDGT